MISVSGKTWGMAMDARPRLIWTALDSFEGTTESYRLVEQWQLHLVNYQADFVLDGEAFVVKPGYMMLTPPGILNTTRFPAGATHYFAHFIPSTTGDAAVMPRVVDTGDCHDEFREAFSKLISYSHVNRTRAEALLWTILFRYRDALGKADSDGLHPALEFALDEIQSRISYHIDIAHLAGQAGISHAHLIRLFRQRFDMTISTYIRKQRMLRARDRMLHTEKPIKEIAWDVGIPDLQQFNKAVKREFGVSPRALRTQKTD